MGKPVTVRLYAPRDGKRTFAGTLSAWDDGDLTIVTPEGEARFGKDEVAKCTAADAD